MERERAKREQVEERKGEADKKGIRKKEKERGKQK